MSDFARLSRAALEAMATAGRAVTECQRTMASLGTSPVGEALQGASPIYEWQHYPAGDIYDPASHGQFFYHAHAASERPVSKGGASEGADEHGHFHIFLRAGGMPAGVSPMVMPELAVADNPAAPKTVVASAPQTTEADSDPWSHLVAIAMDAGGTALRFFTTNRWVTGESWYPAGDVARMIDGFVFSDVAPSPLLDRWVVAMIGLYRPQLQALLLQRDAAIMDWRRRRRAKVHVFEDRRLEVTSVLAIDIEGQIAAVDAALRRVA